VRTFASLGHILSLETINYFGDILLYLISIIFLNYIYVKMKKRLFDLFFVIISASILVVFSEYNFLEKNMAFSFIPILIAYYLGQYSHIWFKK
jgi:hypothetical protein